VYLFAQDLTLQHTPRGTHRRSAATQGVQHATLQYATLQHCNALVR
jgi:hypothetical protein